MRAALAGAVRFANGRPLAFWMAAGLAIHLFYLLSLFTGWLDPLFNDSSHTRRGFDLAVFYLAGQALAAGGDVYQVEGAFGYRYLPAFAWTAGRLLAQFPPPLAYLAYLFFTEALLLAVLYLTWRRAPSPGLAGRALFMWLSFSPLFLELYMGQVSFWAAALLFVLMAEIEKGRDLRTGLVWAGAALIKPNALILAPALLRLRRFRPLLLGPALLVLASLPYFLAHPGSLSRFLDLNLGTSAAPGTLVHAGNLGLYAFLVSTCAHIAQVPLATLSGPGDLPLWAQTALSAGLLAVLLGALLATFRAPTPAPLDLLCLWIATFFLVYRDVWEHHYVFLLPALVALYLRRPEPFLWAVFALLALPTPFAFFDVAPLTRGAIDPERSWSLSASLLYRAAKLGPVLALWLWLLARLKKS